MLISSTVKLKDQVDYLKFLNIPEVILRYLQITYRVKANLTVHQMLLPTFTLITE